MATLAHAANNTIAHAHHPIQITPDWMSKKTNKCGKYKDKDGTKAKGGC